MELKAVCTLIISTFIGMSSWAGNQILLQKGNVRVDQQIQSMSLDKSESNEHIVQFVKPITELDKQKIQQMGFEILGYLPEDALVVRGASLEKLNFPGVRGVIPYLASYKISTSFPSMSVFNHNQTQLVVVSLFKDSDLSQFLESLENLDRMQVYEAEGNTLILEASHAQIFKLAGLPGVEHIQPLPQFKTMDFDLENPELATLPKKGGDYSDLDGSESGTRVMNFSEAWAKGFTGRNQVASMSDTGLDTGDTKAIHTDFSGAVKAGQFFGIFAKSWEDPMGHGTHVAGSIVGRGTASKGALRGGAYEAQFVAQSLWSPMLNNLSLPAKISDLFNKAAAEGASVHSNSWGAATNLGGYDTFARQVDEWAFQNPDLLVVFAAGNSGVDKNKDGRIDANSIATPGTAKNALTVGASENKTATGGIQTPVSKLKSALDSWPAEPIYSSKISDNEKGLAMFSSRGPTQDGRVKPDVVAPGTNILSTATRVSGASELWGRYNESYVWAGGTSMATPLTAGAVTVARQIIQEDFKIAKPSGALLKAVVMHTADDLYPGQFGELGASKGQEILKRRPDFDQGYGRVNVAQIVNMKTGTHLVDERNGVEQGKEMTYEVSVRKGQNLLINLVYADAPASPNAAKTLVNDLDLIVLKPDGTRLSPADRVNNNEYIQLQNLEAGAYKIIVRGNSVPDGKQGKQPFALIWTIN